MRDIIFNKALDLLIAILEDKLTIWELEPELPPELQGLTTTVVTIVTYPAVKALKEKEHRTGELEGLYTPNSVLGELGLREAILWSSPLLELGPSTQSNRLLSWSPSTELGASMVLVLTSKKASNLYRDMRRYATIF